jgi:hypothetical protein
METWTGRVPYVFARYTLAGLPASAFGSWAEQFRGTHQPVQDIADYFRDSYGIEVLKPTGATALDPEIVTTIREYWKVLHDKRRAAGGTFSMNANRLAEHDAENSISVIAERQLQAGKSPLGYTSWWLTLDSAARNMLANLDPGVAKTIGHSSVISIDFLLQYLAFGPNRDLLELSPGRHTYLFAGPVLEIPRNLLEVAQAARSENVGLPERIVQRRIRDAMDRERLKVASVQMAGLDGASEAIGELF